MELQIFQQMTQKLSQFSKQMKVIQEYIHLKFGVDFQDFCQERGIILRRIESSSKRKRRILPAKRKIKISKRLDHKTGHFTGKSSSTSIKTEQDESSNDDEEEENENSEGIVETQIESDGEDQDESNEVNDNSDDSVLQEIIYADLDDSDEDWTMDSYVVTPKSKKGSKFSSKLKRSSRSSTKSSNSQERSDSKSSGTGGLDNNGRPKQAYEGCGRGKDSIWEQFQHIEERTYKCKMCQYQCKSAKADRLRKHKMIKCTGGHWSPPENSNNQEQSSNSTNSNNNSQALDPGPC